jgi:anti-sigma regulatory factor (Ser/Thr protein kinase)
LELEREDNVVVEAAMSHGAIALAVEDNQGTLNPREVLKYLRRQSSGAGVYDSHGRGFHLMSNMVDHLSVCVSPGKKARVVAMNHPGSARPIQTLNFYVAP